MKILFFLLIVVVTGLPLTAQTNRSKPTEFVEVPRDVVLQVIAVQPGCPVRFEEVRYLASTMGGEGSSYELRNISAKAIRSVTVASSNGAVNTYSWNNGVLAEAGGLIQKASNNPSLCNQCQKTKILPLTEELRTKLNLIPPMRGVVTLMILEVRFMDGFVYSDAETYGALTKYSDKLDDLLRK